MSTTTIDATLLAIIRESENFTGFQTALLSAGLPSGTLTGRKGHTLEIKARKAIRADLSLQGVELQLLLTSTSESGGRYDLAIDFWRNRSTPSGTAQHWFNQPCSIAENKSVQLISKNSGYCRLEVAHSTPKHVCNGLIISESDSFLILKEMIENAMQFFGE